MPEGQNLSSAVTACWKKYNHVNESKRIRMQRIQQIETQHACSHETNHSSSRGTDPPAFCEEDASLGAPASHGQPSQLLVCGPFKINVLVVQNLLTTNCCDIVRGTDLFLHQFLQLVDSFHFLWMAANVVFIKKCL